MATPAKPLVLPDTFDGSKESSWEQWIYHFNNVATEWCRQLEVAERKSSNCLSTIVNRESS
jgi:hypothetical protein